MSTTTGHGAPVDDVEAVRRRSFERKARQATHQILFYLELYYRPVSLLSGRIHRRTEEVLKQDSERMVARLKALVDGVGFRDDTVEAGSWKSLRREIEGCEGLLPYRVGVRELSDVETEEKLGKLRASCAEVLDETQPQDSISRITHWIHGVLRRLHRWLAEIIALLAVYFLVFQLEQVGGLVRQAWVDALLPGILLAAPALFAFWLARWRIRRGRQYWWDLGGAAFRNGKARPPERGFGRFAETSGMPFTLMVRILANNLTYIVALVATLLLTWLVAEWRNDSTVFTVGEILAVMFILFGTAQLIDFWDYYDPGPVRMFFLSLLFFALAGVNSFTLWLAPTVLWALTLVFLLRLGWKLVDSRAKGPWAALLANGRAVVVTLGLALLAWLVTNIAFTQFGDPWEDGGEKLKRISQDEWPMPARFDALSAKTDDPVVVLAASGGGSRAAIYVAHTLVMLHEEGFRPGCHLQAISSVSGGSLANAVYVTQRRKFPGCGSELLTRLKGEDGEPGLVELVSGDFLQPTIRGALRGTAFGRFGSGRGRSEWIEDAWKSEPMGLGVDLKNLAEGWRAALKDGGAPPFPLPLFNSTSLEAHRVVLSPLARQLYTDPVVTASAHGTSEDVHRRRLYDRIPERFPEWKKEAKKPTWVYYRDGIYGLEDLLPSFTPNLAQCVRASANFPVGFPLVQVRTSSPLVFSPERERREGGQKAAKDLVYLTDGGVLSNSGVWSLYQLLRRQHGKLEPRGVLVVIVDASGMQAYEPPTRIAGLFGALGSQQPIAQSLHRRMLESLKEQYGERLQVVQVDLIPTEKTNIETTWTLSSRSQESLKVQFEARQAEFATDLRQAWQVLVSRKGEGPTRYLDRPPVD